MPTHSFELENTATAPYDVPVKIYRSKVTGMRIALVNVGAISNGVVNGFFTLATEAHSDDGCPHTLEHLVFLGSEKYPYKGLLDLLANRAFAQGTNAWTATDHTAYTITTAGAEGFINLLPVYLDHILFPTITDSGCYTEVHHINGDGEDSGVVYAEMQARENTCSSLMFNRIQSQLYQGTGYTSETGGKLADLRDLKVSSIRDYHKSYYRSDNLMCIITGDIEAADVFAAVQCVEDKVAKQMIPNLSPMTRPFTEIKAGALQTHYSVVEYADDDTTVGQVFVGWRGPGILDHKTMMSVDLLWTYMSHTPVSPLRRTFTECEEPYCSSVDYMTLPYEQTSQIVTFSGAQVERISEIKDRLVKLLKEVHDTEGIDMKRMADVIEQRRKSDLSAMETDPHNTVSEAIIQWFLYGEGDNDLQSTVDQEADINYASSLTADDWLALLDKYYISTNYVCVEGRPSLDAATKLREDEEKRIAAQRESLGETKLEQLAVDLDIAVAANDVEAPADLISSFRIPDAKKIHTIPVVSIEPLIPKANLTNGSDALRSHLLEGVDSSELPYNKMEFDHVPSKFVELRVNMDTSHLTPTQRLWLELYLDVMFELPINRNGSVIDYEDVVKELERDTVSHGNACGVTGGGSNFVCGSFPVMLSVEIKSQVPEYKKSVEWLGEFLWHSVPNAERFKVAINRLISDIPNSKRSEMTMTLALMRQLSLPSPHSNIYATNLIRQSNFLTNILSRLDAGEEQVKEVMAEFESFRACVTHPNRLTVNVIGNSFSLPTTPLNVWKDIAHTCPFLKEEATKPARVQRVQDLVNMENYGKALVYTPPSTESGYICVTWPGIKEFDDPDLPALKVLMEYMTACEGVFWKALRGKGYSYSYSLNALVEEGSMMFIITKASKLVQAFDESINIFKEFTGESGTTVEFDESLLQAAQSGCIYSELSKGETMSAAARQSFLHNQYTGLGSSASVKRLADIQAVTLDDLRRVAKIHLSGMLNAKLVNMVATVNPSKAEELTNGLAPYGYTLETVPDIEKYFNK
eukprot:CFRG4653T1